MMNKITTKRDLLDNALDVIKREAGLCIKILGREIKKDGGYVDAIIQMPDNGTKLIVEIKKGTTQVNVGAIINQLKNLAEPNAGLFVTDYINPNIAERLKREEIQYMDTTGNTYINQKPIFVYIKGNKPQQAITSDQKRKTEKAFQPTGMKVIFAFLNNRKLINAPYREIAKQAQVALGTVGWVIHDLVAQGFILEGTEKKQRKIADFDRLLDKWVEAYPDKLKEKHKIALFTTEDPNWWEDINLKKFDALWGGEIAAAKYTNYLNPKHAVVYISKVYMGEFLKATRLRKPEPHERVDIQVELVEPFWNQEMTGTQTVKQVGLVHPIIAYADLIETGEARNLDAAKRLREKYIR